MGMLPLLLLSLSLARSLARSRSVSDTHMDGNAGIFKTGSRVGRIAHTHNVRNILLLLPLHPSADSQADARVHARTGTAGL
jgi:hypothetical protein